MLYVLALFIVLPALYYYAPVVLATPTVFNLGMDLFNRGVTEAEARALVRQADADAAYIVQRWARRQGYPVNTILTIQHVVWDSRWWVRALVYANERVQFWRLLWPLWIGPHLRLLPRLAHRLVDQRWR